ncbi:FAD-binding oxidoreductase [Rhizobium sp. KVB221]|uniref:FAD-binding oxidoreductase n=1 Tax=Rhizobium setariae TaxID=2801340 RepID=A0A936YVJ6_9HYPH|nr:FAD-binding oxidoreductase [Rhizobium setariae]MBL0373740.1 FAD-binding oxidoreductase [Rhizobium setariae]
MGPVVDVVPTSTEMPASTDVVIIGGGIIGVSTALFLALRGVSVVLLEKGHIAGEQSSRNWGWVRRMGRDPRELPLIVEAFKIWDGMEALVGEDVGFRRTGILYMCDNDKDVAHHQDWLRKADDYALDSRIVTGPELAGLRPGAAKPSHAALYTGSDGRAEPQKAGPAIVRAAIRAGASVLQQCSVRTIETEGGRVSGVVTERGPIRASTVVIAGGAWSSTLCHGLGIRLPQLAVRSSVMRTGPVEGGPEGAAWADGYAYRKRLDGGYTIAEGSSSRHEIVPDSFRYFRDFVPMMLQEWQSFSLRISPDFVGLLGGNQDGLLYERHRVLDPAPDLALLRRAQSRIERAFPVFQGAPIVQRWAGYIDATPDAVPVISTVKSQPGLVIATGFSGHGFGIGPAAGRLTADIVTGDTPLVDPTPFRYERFIDGTRHRPSTGV